MRLLILAAAFAAIPTAAAAQSITTSCYYGKRYSHCRSTLSPSYRYRVPSDGRDSSYWKVIREGRRLQALQPPPPPSITTQHLRVTQFLTEQDCPGAQRFAAETKNYDTINRVESFCGKAPAIAAAPTPKEPTQ
jgi:hypothetical protein